MASHLRVFLRPPFRHLPVIETKFVLIEFDKLKLDDKINP